MNVLIVGLGSIAEKHIIALKSLNLEVSIYALRSQTNANIVEGITNIFDIQNCDIPFEFAIISNPTNLHAKFISDLSDKKINLLIEKPPVSSLENVAELINKINENNIQTYVACNLRFHPCMMFLKNYLEKNQQSRINEVNIYCGSYLPAWRPNKDFRTIYSANAEMGGGVHLDLFHELDYMFWLFGTPISTKNIKRNVSSLAISAIDYASYTAEYESFSVNMVLNYYRIDAKRTIEILFEDQTITVDLINNCIKNHKNELLFEAPDFKIIDTYKSQIEYYIESLKNNSKKMNTFADSIEVLKMCLKNE